METFGWKVHLNSNASHHIFVLVAKGWDGVGDLMTLRREFVDQTRTWCRENLREGWRVSEVDQIAVVATPDAADAFAFKLRWC